MCSGIPILAFQPQTFNVDSQKGFLYDDDSRNREDESFSDKSHGSNTTNAYSLASAVSNSANVEGVKLVTGNCLV
jgi:hypothetical protein